MKTKRDKVLCEICKAPINIEIENYTIMTDYKGLNPVNTIYVHEVCFKNRIKMFIQFDHLGKGLMQGLQNQGMIA